MEVKFAAEGCKFHPSCGKSALKKLSIYRNGTLISSDAMIILEAGDHIDIPANMKYRLLGNMSILQTLTAMMTLYLTFLAVN